jgi:hypothetical protein
MGWLRYWNETFMHSRRLASLLIGAWLAASIFMDFTAIQNFRSVDRFLSAPGPLGAEQIKAIGGRSEARVFLRAGAAETNRFLFEQWEYTQLALALVLLTVFVFGHGDVPRAALLLAILMMAIVAADRFLLTGEITRLGRLLDFPNTPGADEALFWKLHGVYSGLELLKIALGLGVAGTLVIRHTDRNRFAREHAKMTRPQTGTAA